MNPVKKFDFRVRLINEESNEMLREIVPPNIAPATDFN